jgi:hypothetical protein
MSQPRLVWRLTRLMYQIGDNRGQASGVKAIRCEMEVPANAVLGTFGPE